MSSFYSKSSLPDDSVILIQSDKYIFVIFIGKNNNIMWNNNNNMLNSNNIMLNSNNNMLNNNNNMLNSNNNNNNNNNNNLLVL